MHSLRRPPLLFLLLSSLSLAACGGGGGGSGGNGQDTNRPPLADAGPDLSVTDNEKVTLDASGSSDPDGNNLSYEWTQVNGEPASLENADSAQPHFLAPVVSGGTTLQFTLVVTDSGGLSAEDSVTVSVSDSTGPLPYVEKDVISTQEEIIVHFNESINRDTFQLDTWWNALVDMQVWSTTETSDDTLTLIPVNGWPHGWQDLEFSMADNEGNITNSVVGLAVLLKFDMFQYASKVIGQPDFASYIGNQGLGAADADTLNFPHAAVFDPDTETLYVADTNNARVLGFSGIPSTNTAAADFVIGQPDFTTTSAGVTSSKLSSPTSVSLAGGKLVVVDEVSDRVAIFDSAPTSTGASISVVVGQDDKTSSESGCAANRFQGPEWAAVSPNGKLIVADLYNNRVLIWNSLPTTDGTAADIVLGQADFTSCLKNRNDSTNAAADTLYYPAGIWTDGDRLAVADSKNNRVLIWNSFPTTNGQPADIVLGQPNLASANSWGPSPWDLDSPGPSIWSNGLQFFVSDSGNSRIMIWDSFPTSSYTPANQVLGQSDFYHGWFFDNDQDNLEDDVSGRVFGFATAIEAVGSQMIVTDRTASRVLIFDSR